MPTWTHKSLCEKAVKWMKRPYSQNGPSCHIAVSEVKTGTNGEIPDVFGVRAADWLDGSVLVEVKVSRSDFLSDFKKPHRDTSEGNSGVGNWRYYLCPENMISIDEIPEKWGLLYINARGRIDIIEGAHKKEPRTPSYCQERLSRFWHKADQSRERFIITKLLYRVGDVEAYNAQLKKIRNENRYLTNQVNSLLREKEKLSRRLTEELMKNDPLFRETST